jgi:hypothetical protein
LRCRPEQAREREGDVKTEKTGIDRRQLLRALGAGAAAAGAPLASEALADSESYDERRKPRYRESEEVKTYYRVNRYPS